MNDLLVAFISGAIGYFYCWMTQSTKLVIMDKDEKMITVKQAILPLKKQE